jgi:hypothetical protein
MATKIGLRKILVVKIYLCLGQELTAMRHSGLPVKKIKAVNVPILYRVHKLMKVYGAIP